MKKIVILLNGVTPDVIQHLKESTEKNIYIDKDSLTESDKQAILQLKQEVHAERLEWKLIQKVSNSISNFSGTELVLVNCEAFTNDGLTEVKKIVKQTYFDSCTSFEVREVSSDKKEGDRTLFYISGTTSFPILAELITKKHKDTSVTIDEVDLKASDKLFIPAVNAPGVKLVVKRTPEFNKSDIDFCNRASEAGLPGPFSIHKLKITTDESEPKASQLTSPSIESEDKTITTTDKCTDTDAVVISDIGSKKSLWDKIKKLLWENDTNQSNEGNVNNAELDIPTEKIILGQPNVKSMALSPPPFDSEQLKAEREEERRRHQISGGDSHYSGVSRLDQMIHENKMIEERLKAQT